MMDMIGRTIGQYQLVELIHEGDNTIYKGFQPSLNRYVAVKILSSDRASDPAFAQQFQRDMQLIASLEHPNLLPVYDYGVQEGLLYLVTPYVEDGTIKDRLPQFYSIYNANQALTAIAGALEYLHNRGITHGNLKPSNILLDPEGQPLLADFGYSQGIDTGVQENVYLSPELAQGGQFDRRADVYALGVLLYQMVIGEAPQPGMVPSPRQARPDLPPDVEKVILKAMAQFPEQRFQTAGEFSQALTMALGAAPAPATTQPTPVAAPVPPVTSPTPELPPEADAQQDNKRLYWLIGGGAVVLLILLACILFYLFGSGSSGGGVVPTPVPGVPSVTANSNVNIRSGPGTEYDIIGLLETGQSAEAVGRSPDQLWWAVKVPGAPNNQGWVSAELVTAQNTANVPILEPPPTPTPPASESEAPKAVINGTTQAVVGQTVNFTARNSSVAEGSHLVTFEWDFDDGTTASGVDVSHVYDEPGTYRVKLTVIDDKGLSSTARHNVKIDDAPSPPEPDEPPVAVISAPTEATVGEQVTFDASASQPADRITSYAWEFGDGGAANAVTVNHAYSSPGVYNVILTVTDDQGLQGSSNVQIRVEAEEPAPTEEPPDGGDLEGRNWLLDGSLADTEVTALFEGGTVSGSSGCNTYSADYEADGNNLSVGPANASGLACADEVMAQEDGYLAALAGAQRYRVSDNTLEIRGSQTLNYTER